MTGDLKKAVVNLIDRAIIYREREARLRQEIEDVKQQVQTAPERIEAIENELDQPIPPPENVATIASRMRSDEFEAQLREVKTDLSEKTAALNRLTDQLNALRHQPAKLQQEVSRLKQVLRDISGELAAGAPPDEPQPVVNTRKLALSAEQASIETEIKTIEYRLANHDILSALLAAECDLAARQTTRQEVLVKIWRAEAQRIREREAQKDRAVAEEARKLAVDLPPVLQNQFDINIELGKLLEKAIAEEALVAEKLQLKQVQLKQIEEEFAIAREQLQYPMQTETIGLALYEQRRVLVITASISNCGSLSTVSMTGFPCCTN